jgi:hypothetical protein
MSTRQYLYYYQKDPEITNKYIAVPSTDISKDNFSLLDLATYPLYDNDFKKNGLLTRFVTDIYLENNNTYYQVYYYTIFFDNTNDSINFNFTFISNPDNGGIFPPNVPINCVITSCSGSIYNKRGTVQLLPLDNEPQSRILTIDLY